MRKTSRKVLFICENSKCKHKQYAPSHKGTSKVLGMGCEKCGWNARRFEGLKLP